MWAKLTQKLREKVLFVALLLITMAASRITSLNLLSLDLSCNGHSLIFLSITIFSVLAYCIKNRLVEMLISLSKTRRKHGVFWKVGLGRTAKGRH